MQFAPEEIELSEEDTPTGKGAPQAQVRSNYRAFLIAFVLSYKLRFCDSDPSQSIKYRLDPCGY